MFVSLLFRSESTSSLSSFLMIQPSSPGNHFNLCSVSEFIQVLFVAILLPTLGCRGTHQMYILRRRWETDIQKESHSSRVARGEVGRQRNHQDAEQVVEWCLLMGTKRRRWVKILQKGSIVQVGLMKKQTEARSRVAVRWTLNPREENEDEQWGTWKRNPAVVEKYRTRGNEEALISPEIRKLGDDF